MSVQAWYYVGVAILWFLIVGAGGLGFCLARVMEAAEHHAWKRRVKILVVAIIIYVGTLLATALAFYVALIQTKGV